MTTQFRKPAKSKAEIKSKLMNWITSLDMGSYVTEESMTAYTLHEHYKTWEEALAVYKELIEPEHYDEEKLKKIKHFYKQLVASEVNEENAN